MTTTEAVDRGLQIRSEMSKLKSEIEEIEAILEAAGLDGDQIDLNDPDREGKQFLAKGTAQTVPVVFTADLIVGQFVDDSPVHVRLKEIAGDKLKEFFRKKTVWENLAKSGKQFRSLAAGILEDKAPAFIHAATARDRGGIPKSNVKIEWDRAEAHIAP